MDYGEYESTTYGCMGHVQSYTKTMSFFFMHVDGILISACKHNDWCGANQNSKHGLFFIVNKYKLQRRQQGNHHVQWHSQLAKTNSHCKRITIYSKQCWRNCAAHLEKTILITICRPDKKHKEGIIQMNKERYDKTE